MMNRVWGVITIIVICIVTFIGCNNMKFNNSANKNDLLTEKYSIAQIEELKNSAESEHITFSKFKKDFDIQCVRKTHQGYYVVLLLEDNRNAFAFFNEGNKLISVMIVNEFKGKEEFHIQALEQMSKSEVLRFDPNTILMPVSAVDMTAHIVQEGICIVKYSRFLDGKIIEDPIVSSVEFIENKSIPTSEDIFVRDEIPFIFEFDKASE